MKKMTASEFRRFFISIIGTIAALALIALAVLIASAVLHAPRMEIGAATFFSAFGLVFTLFTLANLKRFKLLQLEYESAFNNPNAINGTIELPITHMQFFSGKPVSQGNGGVRMSKESIDLLDSNGTPQRHIAWSDFLYAKVAVLIVPQIFLSHEPIHINNHEFPQDGFTGISILASPDAMKGVELFGGLETDETLLHKVRGTAMDETYAEGKNKLLYAFMGLFGFLSAAVCTGLGIALFQFGLPLAAVMPLAEIPCMLAVFALSGKFFGNINRNKYFLSGAGLTYTHGINHETVFFERITRVSVTNGSAQFESRLIGDDGLPYKKIDSFPIPQSVLDKFLEQKQKNAFDFEVDLGENSEKLPA